MRTSEAVVQRPDGHGHISVVPMGNSVYVLVDSGHGASAVVPFDRQTWQEVVQLVKDHAETADVEVG